MEAEEFTIYGSCKYVSGGRNDGEDEDLDGEEENELGHEFFFGLWYWFVINEARN